jgi:hypothetical protein
MNDLDLEIQNGFFLSTNLMRYDATIDALAVWQSLQSGKILKYDNFFNNKSG